MTPVGQGTFRTVYAHPAHPDNLVVKVPREGMERYGRLMNQEEIRAAKLFPNLFPRTHNENRDALVVDRADAISSDLSKFFPSILRLKEIGVVNADWLLLREMIRLRIGQETKTDIEKRFKISRRIVSSFAKKDHLVSMLADAVKELEIDVEDIAPANAGVSRRTGRFVLVDASTMTGFRG